MKTAMMAMVLLAVLAAGVAAQDVRGVSWGMTQAQVMAVEGQDANYRNEEMIGYQRTMLDETTQMGYMFRENRLESIVMHFEDVAIFNRLKSALTRKYGKPAADGLFQVIWIALPTSIMLNSDVDGVFLVYGDYAAGQAAGTRQQRADAAEL